MLEEKMSLIKNNQDVKKDKHSKKKKRKFSAIAEECVLNSSGTSKVLKKASPEDIKNFHTSEHDVLQLFHFKNTADYAKVVAKPAFKPYTPKIFQLNNIINGLTSTADSFFSNFLSSKSFNSETSERFNFLMSQNEKVKKKEEFNKITENKVNLQLKSESKEEKKALKKIGQESFSEPFEEISSRESKKKITEDLYIKSYVDSYEVPQKAGLIFHLHHPSTFSFHGQLKLTIITGEVEILGYSLSSSSSKNWVNVYSPNLCISLTVETKSPKQNQPVEEVHSMLKNLLAHHDYNKLLANLKPEDSVLFVEQITSTFGIVINKYFDKVLFSNDLENISSINESLQSFQSTFNFYLSQKGKYFRKSPEWDRIPLGHCTVLCGGKGVGKSTLLKYYLNKFATLGEKVLCLDFDLGQPEFTFPGCVSAVIVEQPLLGPNFTHIIDPTLMMNFGNIDVCSDPSKYLECVKFIIDSCRKDEKLLKMKWFVNTMGFCKGLGVNLLISTLKLLKPNTVIQIKSSDHRNNFPMYLASWTLNSKPGFESMPLHDVVLSYDLRVIQSRAEYQKKQLKGGLKPRELRDIMSISYFSKLVSPPFYNFNAVQPYLISFSKLYLAIESFINFNDVLKAFNGNLVSLSHFEPDYEDIFSVESEEDTYFKVVIKPRLVPCLGIGLVRGIDCKEKKFYLLTHLPGETLEKVNCLSLGRISPPYSLYLKQETVENQKPYTTIGSADFIKRVRRMFRAPEADQK